MTAYFDSMRSWLTDLGQAEHHAAHLTSRAQGVVARTLFPLDASDLEPLGWAYYLTQGALAECIDVPAVVVVAAIEAKMRRDLRFLEAALHAETGQRPLGFAGLWARNPSREDIFLEDLAPMAQRVKELCDQAHSLMHEVARVHSVSDNPAAAAQQVMDRIQGGPRP